MKVAAIEVGSRAIRLLVAGVTDGKFVQLASDVDDVDLMRALSEGNEFAASAKARSIIDRFRQRAIDAGAERVQVFGTEAVRRFAADGLLDRFGDLEPLSKADEARCSLIASARGLPVGGPGGTLAAIDHGNGSLEVAVGTNGLSLQMLGYVSLPLGGNALLKILAECDFVIDQFAELTAEQLAIGPLADKPADNVVIQGSVATKCAWLSVRKDLNDRYDPRRVHGCRLNTAGLNQVIAVARSTPRSGWKNLSKIVNPRDLPTDQFERLFTGCVVLSQLLAKMGSDEFHVSAHGTRHGVAWKLAGLD